MSEGADALEGLDEKTPKLSKTSDTGQHQIPPLILWLHVDSVYYSTEFFAGIERISPDMIGNYIAIFNSKKPGDYLGIPPVWFDFLSDRAETSKFKKIFKIQRRKREKKVRYVHSIQGTYKK